MPPATGTMTAPPSPVIAPAAPVAVAPLPPTVQVPTGAVLYTDLGKVQVRFLTDQAPATVANFAALATGTTSWIDLAAGQPVQRPFYDGTQIHRVLPDVLIQGGMPALVAGSTTTATGPGYVFPDEPSAPRKFDKPGLLAMASPGPDSNGSQFFITLAPLPWLDGKHVVFGEVTKGLDKLRDMSHRPRDRDDRPLEPIVLKKVKIEYR